MTAREGTGDVEFRIDGGRLVATVFLTCVALEVLVFLLDYHVNYAYMTEIGAIRRLFNNAREDGLGSFLSITQVSLIALTVWVIVAVERRVGSRRALAGWIVLALFFTYMAFDDGTKIHERVGTAFHVLHRNGPESSWERQVLDVFPSYTWQIVFLPAFATLGLFMLGFLWRQLASPLSVAMVVAALGCFVFAVWLDFIEGLDEEHRWNVYRLIAETWDLRPFTYDRFQESPFRTLRHFSKSLEECVEMLGNTLLWCVFLRHLTSRMGGLRIAFGRATR